MKTHDLNGRSVAGRFDHDDAPAEIEEIVEAAQSRRRSRAPAPHRQ